MNSLTKQIHNAQVSNIINIINKNTTQWYLKQLDKLMTTNQKAYKEDQVKHVRHTQHVSELLINDDEQSKLQPDIVTKDNQTFNFSVSQNQLAMYKTKIEKYGKIFDNKNVIPIIITPWLQMDPRSVIEMSRYCKPDKLFKSLSFWTIYMKSQKLEKYSSYSKDNNLNHFDTEVQTTAQAAQSSAKKVQTNNNYSFLVIYCVLLQQLLRFCFGVKYVLNKEDITPQITFMLVQIRSQQHSSGTVQQIYQIQKRYNLPNVSHSVISSPNSATRKI
ncbi:Hypothetical_protein [Hexamita inflata]|uniref:Hypothetical_protein n=1 Tax=Hexamita inflata TaxID=28002 RepID=A0AA86TFM4_9EUKA|nr:Hypothetical protein HINF_LOCUS4005 [Hexamita inflata]